MQRQLKRGVKERHPSGKLGAQEESDKQTLPPPPLKVKYLRKTMIT